MTAEEYARELRRLLDDLARRRDAISPNVPPAARAARVERLLAHLDDELRDLLWKAEAARPVVEGGAVRTRSAQNRRDS